MRVALLTLHTSPLEMPGTQNSGGLNVVVLELARELADLGHAVTLIGPSQPESALSCSDSWQFSSVTLEAGLPSVIGPSVASAEEDPQGVTLARMLDEFDIIHSHYWRAAQLAERAMALRTSAGKANPHHVMSLHTVGAAKIERAGEWPGSAERVLAEAELARRVPIIASSSAEAGLIQQYYEVPDERISVVLPGVDTDLFHPDRATKVSNRNTIAVVGRIQPFKGQDFALDVLSNMHPNTENAHLNLELVFAGNHTPEAQTYFKNLVAEVERRGLKNRVRFIGATDRAETAELLAQSVLTIIPSRSETFGLVALESAACETPVLAQAVDGLAESVAHGQSGILMAVRDAAAWAEAALALIADAPALRNLAVSARLFALEHTWQQTARAAEAVYARLTSVE